MQRISLAIYDPSQPSSDGSFWSWRAPGLDRKLLDQLYYEVAAANRPVALDQLGNSYVIGGFAKAAHDWVFVYRFGDGGRDAHGRPGRFVMVVGGLRIIDAGSIDLAAILTCPPFVDVLAQAPFTCPVPAPAELEVDIEGSPSDVDPVLLAKALRDERLEISGPEALRQAASVCANLPPERQWTCGLHVDGQVGNAVVECPQPTRQAISRFPEHASSERTPTSDSEPAPPRQSRAMRVPAMLVAAVLVGMLAGWFWWQRHHPETQPQPIIPQGQSLDESDISAADDSGLTDSDQPLANPAPSKSEDPTSAVKQSPPDQPSEKKKTHADAP